MQVNDEAAAHTSIAGLVLASGMSRRFRGENKLLLEIDGVSVVRRAATAYTDAGLRSTLVVVGYDADQVKSALRGLPLSFVHNPDYQHGQSRALVRGTHALPPNVPAAVIGVADQPYLTAGIIRALVDRYRTTGAPLVAPRYGGRRGNPVLFDSSLFPELLKVEGDTGGRPVILRHLYAVEWVDIADERAGFDVDTVEDYRRLQALP